MILYIKNMVCIRCKMVVKSDLEKLGIYKAIIDLGEVRIRGGITSEQREKLNISLKKDGFELVDEKKGMLYEKIKKIVVEMVHYSDEQLKINFQDYLCKKLNRDYSWLDNLFFEIKNITIEKFFINHKIEKVKAPPKAETWVCYSKKKKVLISELSQEDSKKDLNSPNMYNSYERTKYKNNKDNSGR